jgi:hypothetical protein
MRSIRVLGLLLAATIPPFTACSSSSSPAGSSGSGFSSSSIPWAGPDVDPPSSVTLQPDVVIVHGGASAVSADHGVWTLNKSASGVSSLAPGKVLLIAGIDCARVTAMQDNGATVDVTVAPVNITDVIQQGSLQWDSSAVDTTHGYIGQIPYGEVVSASTTSGAGTGDGGLMSGLRVQDTGSNNPTTGVSVKIGNWTVAMAVSKSGSGSALDMNTTATWSPGGGSSPIPGDPSSTLGGINAGVQLALHAANFKANSGSVTVSGGAITSASLTSSVEGSVDVDANVSTPHGSQFPQAALLKFPIAAEFPLEVVPGLPMYLSVKSAISIQPSLATANSVLDLKAHADFSGSAGMSFGNGMASPTSSPTATTPADPLASSNAPPELGTMAMVFAIQAPRIGVGVGSMSFGIGAGLYVDVVNSFTLTIASATALVPCEGATWDFSAHGGGEMAIKVLPNLNVTHQVDLIPSSATWNHQTWYVPHVNACKI